MTDEEEMARLYLIEKYGLRKDLEIERIQHNVLSLEFYTYIAGLKAGEKLGFEKGVKAKVNTTTISDYPVKPVWHSVAAGDLPKEKKLYLVAIKDNGLAIAYFNGLHWETKYNLGDFGHCVETVIAWKEIIPPKQEEDKNGH